MTYLKELRKKWMPILKEDEIDRITSALYKKDVESYKRASPDWEENFVNIINN